MIRFIRSRYNNRFEGFVQSQNQLGKTKCKQCGSAQGQPKLKGAVISINGATLMNMDAGELIYMEH